MAARQTNLGQTGHGEDGVAIEGNILGLGFTQVRLVLTGADTGGAFAVSQQPLQPRAPAGPLHSHSNEDGFIYVVRGRIGAQLDARVVQADEGATVMVPKGMRHTFWNPTEDGAEVLELSRPPDWKGGSWNWRRLWLQARSRSRTSWRADVATEPSWTSTACSRSCRHTGLCYQLDRRRRVPCETRVSLASRRTGTSALPDEPEFSRSCSRWTLRRTHRQQRSGRVCRVWYTRIVGRRRGPASVARSGE